MNPIKPLSDVMDAVVFPFKALFILAICASINWMTAPHHLWVKWVALGLGIAMVAKFAKALKALLVAGVVAAAGWAVWRWWKNRPARSA